MSRHSTVALAAIGIVLAATAQASSGEADHGPQWSLLGLQVLNLGILAFILFRFARKPLNDFLTQRSRGIRDQIESAERSLHEAQAEMAELRGRLERFDQETQTFVANAAVQAEAEAERNLARANETSVRIQEDARRVANQEIARARLELQAEAAALATSLAGEILREKLSAADDRRIVSEFIDRAGNSS